MLHKTHIRICGLALATLTACGDTAALTPPTGSLTSNLTVAMAASTSQEAGQGFVDPTTNAGFCAGGGGGGRNDPNHASDPNQAACQANLQALRTDQKALRASPEYQAALASPTYVQVQADVDALRANGCKSILTASPACQQAITSLDADVQAFWKSGEFTALQNSASFKAAVTDMTNAQAAGCFSERGGRQGGRGRGDGGRDND